MHASVAGFALWLVAGVPLLLGGPGAAQNPAEAAATAAAVADRIDQLRDAMRDRAGKRDVEATQLVVSLGADYAVVLAADRKKIVRAVSAALTKGALRRPDKAGVYRAAVEALAAMGPDGSRALQKVYSAKRIPHKAPWLPLRAQILDAVGRTRDPRAVSFLCERAAREGEDALLAAVGKTLVHYRDADQKTRKRIAKAMISKLGGLEGTAGIAVMRTDLPMDLAILNAQRTLDVISDQWNATLREITGQSFDNGTDWQRWYNKNKASNWDRSGAARR